jgi:hypothetical protein
VSNALEILASGGLVRFDGLLLSLDHELWPWVGRSLRDKNWGPCKYAQMSLRRLLYGSPILCGAVAWLVLVTVTILVRPSPTIALH